MPAFLTWPAIDAGAVNYWMIAGLVFLAVFVTQFGRTYIAASLGFKDFSSPYWPNGRDKAPAFNFLHYDANKTGPIRVGVADFAAPFYNALGLLILSPLLGLLLGIFFPHQLNGFWALWRGEMPAWAIGLAMYKGVNNFVILIAIQILKVARPSNHGFWSFPAYTLGVIGIGLYAHNLDWLTGAAAIGVAVVSLSYLFLGTGRQEMDAKGWIAMGVCIFCSTTNILNDRTTLHVLGWFTYMSITYGMMLGVCLFMATVKPVIGILRSDGEVFRREGFRLFWPQPKAKVAQVSIIHAISEYTLLAAMGNVLSILTVFGAMRLASLAMMYFGDRWQFGREERYFTDPTRWPDGYVLKPFRVKVAGRYGFPLFALVLFIAYMRQTGAAG